MKITRKQIEAWNVKAGNGFKVNLWQVVRKRKNFNDLLEISNADNGLRDEQLIKMFKRLSQEKEGAC